MNQIMPGKLYDLSRDHPKWWFIEGIPPNIALIQVSELPDECFFKFRLNELESRGFLLGVYRGGLRFPATKLGEVKFSRNDPLKITFISSIYVWRLVKSYML